MTTPALNPQFRHSSQPGRWTDECFREQVPVANPNYRKCFLAPKGYETTLRKVKKNRNRIPCNALFRGQSHLLGLVFCARFYQESLKGGDRVYRERKSGWCHPHSQPSHCPVKKMPRRPPHSWNQMWGKKKKKRHTEVSQKYLIQNEEVGQGRLVSLSGSESCLEKPWPHLWLSPSVSTEHSVMYLFFQTLTWSSWRFYIWIFLPGF